MEWKVAKEVSEKHQGPLPSTRRGASLDLKTHESLAVHQKIESPNRLAAYPVRLLRAC